MSETSSDTESSCGWTIISNEGSDIETLMLEAAVDCGAALSEFPPVPPQTHLQEAPDTHAGCDAEKVEASADDAGEPVDETLDVSEDEGGSAARQATMLSSSDHSDIMTLGDVREGEQTAEDVSGANEELYLGTSCSSQYTFTAVETGFPAQQPAHTNSSSSEDEPDSSSWVVRRRRLRRNTQSVGTDPEEDRVVESGLSVWEEDEEEEKKKKQEQQTDLRAAAVDVQSHRQGSTFLNRCVLLALVIALSMGFGHFHGTVQTQQRQKLVNKVRGNELDDVKDFIHKVLPVGADLDEATVVLLLTEEMRKMKTENKELNMKLVDAQVQRNNLELLLQQKAAERIGLLHQQLTLTTTNRHCQSNLEQQEKSVSSLQEELRTLRSETEHVEPLASENQRLRDKLQQEKQLLRSFRAQRDNVMAEAQTLKKKLDKERKVSSDLTRKLHRLKSSISAEEQEAASEAEELQSRLTELEKRLSFEQQRSDLWERLYVETKEERAKGDTEVKAKTPKEGMTGRVKETFDALKNSTKEFVHHHKEQIKKAKEAVKENLRKFSDSVKSTFRHFKDSASTFMNKAQAFYKAKRDDRTTRESWQGRHHHHHHHRHHKPKANAHCNSNTRKSGDKVDRVDREQNLKAKVSGCSGLFHCADHESTRLLNKALEPVRADEFHQLLQSYVQQEVEHFHHWKQLDKFINNFFHNGVFIHEHMLFTDFVSGVEDFLLDMREYHGLHDDVFGDLDDFIYRHFFGDKLWPQWTL